MRYVLMIECVLALVIHGQVMGVIAMKKSPPLTLMHIGFFGLLTYVLAFQLKAIRQGVAFDEYSWIGVGLLFLLIIGLGTFLWAHTHSHRG